MKKLITSIISASIIACMLVNSGQAFSQSGGAIFAAGPLMNSTRIYPLMATLSDGKVIAFGGRASGFNPSAYADVYDPVANTFTEVAMNFPHDQSPVVKLSDGRYYIIGGAMSAGVPAYSSCEMYDPIANTFTTAGSLAYARMWASAAQLTNGHVLIVGAWYDATAASIAEYYDTMSHAYTATNPLAAGRANPIVLPADDGGAIVCGGWGSYAGSAIASVEYYNPADNSFHPVSTQLIPSDSGWTVCGTPYHNRPYADYKMTDGKYLLFGSRGAEYGLIAYDPAVKSFTRINTATPIMDALTNGGFFDLVLDKAHNIAYLLGVDSGYTPAEISLTAVNLTSGFVYHPTATFPMPAGEYLYPSLAFMPTVGKILLEGISSTSGDYFHATDKSYVITPQLPLYTHEEEPAAGAFGISLYPNPARSVLNIVLTGADKSAVDVRIYDIVGNSLMGGRYTPANGVVRINLANLPAGIYFTEVRGGGIAWDKFIKQ